MTFVWGRKQFDTKVNLDKTKVEPEQNFETLSCPSYSSKSSKTSSLLPRTKFHYVNVNWPFEWAGHSWCFAQIPFRFTVAQSKLLLSIINSQPFYFIPLLAKCVWGKKSNRTHNLQNCLCLCLCLCLYLCLCLCLCLCLWQRGQEAMEANAVFWATSKTSKTVKLRKSQSAYKIYHLWHSRPNGISIFNISMQIAMVNIAHTHNVKNGA